VNFSELFKKNIIFIPVVASIVVGSFTGVRYIVSLTETINKNKKEITTINETHLHNFKTYIARIQENQNHLLLKLETNKGNTIVTDDKMERLEEKIKQLEIDFKNLLIKRSNWYGDSQDELLFYRHFNLNVFRSYFLRFTSRILNEKQ